MADFSSAISAHQKIADQAAPKGSGNPGAGWVSMILTGFRPIGPF
jgi:hypothetical protein